MMGESSVWWALAFGLVGCGGVDHVCGPTRGVVERVVDGDTVELSDGSRLRYLLVDTPELGGAPECYGLEAKRQNEALVLGKEVELDYDVECRDRYERLLAYVFVGQRMVNEVLLERGCARVRVFAPNDRYEARLRAAEAVARTDRVGLWETCR